MKTAMKSGGCKASAGSSGTASSAAKWKPPAAEKPPAKLATLGLPGNPIGGRRIPQCKYHDKTTKAHTKDQAKTTVVVPKLCSVKEEVVEDPLPPKKMPLKKARTAGTPKKPPQKAPPPELMMIHMRLRAERQMEEARRQQEQQKGKPEALEKAPGGHKPPRPAHEETRPKKSCLPEPKDTCQKETESEEKAEEKALRARLAKLIDCRPSLYSCSP